MARIFTVLAFMLAVNIFIPVVNAYSPYSSEYTSPVGSSFGVANIMPAIGCATSVSGKAAAATSTTLTDSTQNWGSNVYANDKVTITSGSDKGDAQTVASNTGSVLTILGSWAVTPSVGDTYILNDICSASVAGGFSNTILGPVVNTILVFGNFFAAANFLVQLAGGVFLPSFYVTNWLGGYNYPPAVMLALVYQALVWLTYGSDMFYILSGRQLLPWS